MKTYFLINALFVIVRIKNNHARLCGCKETRRCYQDMVNALKDHDEVSCIEDASIGVSTVMIFLKALKQYCPEYISVVEDLLTYEGRHLYEVILDASVKEDKIEEDNKPVIFIDAGQEAGTECVGMALYIIEQLMACEENYEMLKKVKWVILPSTNPDGMEYGRYNRVSWKKNVKPSEDGMSYGVDISRNFDFQWGACETIESGFSPEFPGLGASTENETMFIKKSYIKNKKNLKIYLSVRRDGHAILYPYAYSKMANAQQSQRIASNDVNLIKLAGDVASRVNQRAGGVQIFTNASIYEVNGKPHCGHSVDWAYSEDAPLAYEMRVFIGKDNRIMAKFQQLPRGYEASLRLGYFSGIKELYNHIVTEKKYRQGLFK